MVKKTELSLLACGKGVKKEALLCFAALVAQQKEC